MSEYLVTARKWRPMKFEDVAGQDHVTVTLRNAISTNRLAHAYLFSGPRGVGKTTTARILAKVVNCLHPVDNNPDNECQMCREITEGRSFDVLEIDGASNRGIEEIRNLRESARYTPSQGKYKVYIIDEVHMLTKEAFNALLKTLEEPPSHVLFIFATTEIHKVPATILSRCQRFDFRRIAIDAIIKNLREIAVQEGLSLDDDALLLIARKGDGSLRDAQSLFDQVVSLCGRTISHEQILHALHIVDTGLFFRVTELVRLKDAQGGLRLVDELMAGGHDPKEFLSGLTGHLRNILIANTTGSSDLIETSDLYKKRYAEEATLFTLQDILRMLRQVGATETALRWSSQPRFKLEADLVQMITMPTAPEIGEVLQKIDELKKKLSDAKTSPVAAPSRQISTFTHPLASTSRVVRETARQNEATSQASPQPLQSLSEGEVLSRWPEFVGEVRRQRISLGSVLESTTILGSQGGLIRLGCANEFQASSIKRNKTLLSSVLQQVFHTGARLEVEIHSNLIVPPTSPGETPVTVSRSEEHPVIKAMMRELGAEPLQ